MKKILFVILALIAVFLIACEKKVDYPTGYAAYQGQGQPQQQYVGGSCGVAPAEINSDLPEINGIAA